MWFRRHPDRDREMRAHLELEEAALRAAGMSDDEARRAARLKFGEPTLARERVADGLMFRWLGTLWQDARYGARLLRRNPAFSVTAALVLSLGIGVNTALFSVLNSLYFTPPPMKAPDDVFYLADKSSTGILRDEYLPLSEGVREMAELTNHFLMLGATVSLGDLTARQPVEYVMANYFEVLGLSMARGRALDAADNEPSNPDPGVIVSYDYWSGPLQSDPNVIGRQVRVFTTFYRVAGVAPRGFRGLSSPWSPIQFWVPFSTLPYSLRSASPVGRLKPGVTLDQLRQAVVTHLQVARAQRYGRAAPAPDAAQGVRVYRASDVTIPSQPEGTILSPQKLEAVVAVVTLILIIAIANVAGMLLARGVTRGGEVAVRRALGASGWRIARQLLTETLLLALAAGGCGGLLAVALVRLYAASAPPNFGVQVAFDLNVFLFAFTTSIGVGLLVGMAPTLQAVRMTAPNTAGSAVVSGHRVIFGLRQGVLVIQLALSLALLVVASVHVRALVANGLRDLGYAIEGVSVFEFGLWQQPSPSLAIPSETDAERARRMFQSLAEQTARRREFERAVVDRIGAIPGVVGTGFTSRLPLREGGSSGLLATTREDFEAVRPAHLPVLPVYASAGYFAALEMPLRRGRLFDERRDQDQNAVIVSESLARALFPNGDGIGLTIGLTDRPSNDRARILWCEVVGIVADVDPVVQSDGSKNHVYSPLRGGPLLVVRSHGSQAAMLPVIRQAILGVDPQAEVISARPLSDVANDLLYQRRMAAVLLSAGGLAGLVLAAIGLYGAAAHAAAQRLRELGVRAALGANSNDLIALLLKDGVRVMTIGSVAGLALSFIPLRLTAWMFPGLPAVDLVSFTVVPALLLAVVLTACFIPARRAARMDPAKVLRGE